MILTTSSPPTWMQVDAPAPKSSAMWTPWLERQRAIEDAMDETVLAPALGQGKDFDELWNAYNRSLPVFAHLLGALTELLARAEPSSSNPSDHIHDIAKMIASLVPEQFDALALIQHAFRDLRRAEKVAARLARRGRASEFLESESGRRSVSASLGFPWGMFGIVLITRQPDAYSKEDLYFCLTLIEHGPRDHFAFLRSFELDLDDEAASDGVEIGEMSDDLKELEDSEFDESERLLVQAEQG